MKIYLVGGAIRNKLLLLPVKEKDWVVVGSSKEEMINLGYKKVGKDFPVFIHPKSHEEYALARTEKKNGHGYTGFKCFYSSNVSLNEDLYRRDLTINAIAEDENGNLIDPFFGIRDLNKKIIRHISDNFKDDPLRVLRVARFFSYLYHLNFKISPKTFNLMKLIIKNGELSYLTSERILKETKKAILTKNPEYYFEILNKCGGLIIIFPEIFNLLNIKNKKIKNSIFFLIKIKKIKYLKLNFDLRFISLLYIIIKFSINNILLKLNFNKIKKNILNKKIIVTNMCNRLKLSNFLRKKVICIIENIYFIEKIEYLNSLDIVKLFYLLKINKKKADLMFIIKSTLIDKNKKKIFIDKYNNLYDKKQYLLKIWDLINSINIKKIISKKFNGKEIKDKIFKNQIKSVNFWTKNLILIKN